MRCSVLTLAMLASPLVTGAYGARLTASDYPTKASTETGGTLVRNYVLSTPGGIKGFNPFLTDAEAVNAASLTGADCSSAPYFATCADTPALASGFTTAPSENGVITFLAISDRGPNQDCGDLSDVNYTDTSARNSKFGATAPAPQISSGKGFPVKKFSPTLGKVQLDSDGTAVATKTCFLKRTDGTPASGVSTRLADDVPYDGWCQASIPYDHGGQDAEDIQEIPGTKYGIICDEYSPSVSIISLDWDTNDCGKLLKRYVPKDVDKDLTNGGYPVSGILPKSLDQRRKNRGFENVAVSPDGKLAVAIMQSAMQVADQSYFDKHNSGVKFDTRDAEMLPAVFLDISSPLEAKVLGTKWYPIDTGKTWSVEGKTRATPKDNDRIKLSAAFMPNKMLGIDDNKQVLVILERETSVRLYLTDFEVATYTDESTMSAAHVTLLNTTANLEAKGVKLAKKQLIVDTKNIAAWATEGNSNKAEGFSLVNEFTAVLANDNDFGLEGNPATKISIVQLPKSIKDVAKELGVDKYVTAASPASRPALAFVALFGASLFALM